MIYNTSATYIAEVRTRTADSKCYPLVTSIIIHSQCYTCICRAGGFVSHQLNCVIYRCEKYTHMTYGYYYYYNIRNIRTRWHISRKTAFWVPWCNFTSNLIISLVPWVRFWLIILLWIQLELRSDGNINPLHSKQTKNVLCLTKYHAMKTYWGVEVNLHVFVTSALDGGEPSASNPGCLTPRETALGTHWMGDWVGPRAGKEAVVKRKSPCPVRNRAPVVQLVA